MQIPIYLTSLEWSVDRDSITDLILEQHQRYPYHLHPGDASLPLIDNKDKDLDNLYTLFFEHATKWLGPLELKKNNRRNVWAYVCRSQEFFQGIHDHRHTCEINAVYYHKIPKTKFPIAGCLGLYNNKNELRFWFKPKEKDLIIYPGWLKHEPMPPDSDDFRIAINMEINCQEIWSKNLENF
jgi:hypothetical protein